jgi:fibronectin-binding autotransporter adhesin
LQAFNSLPSLEDGWSTGSVPGGTSTHQNPGDLDATVQTFYAELIQTPLPQSGTWPPDTNNFAQWNSSRHLLQTHATGNAATVLMTTLVNDTGASVDTLHVWYDFGSWNVNQNENVFGHRTFYSLTGQAGSWQLIDEFSTFSSTVEAGATRLYAALDLGALGSWTSGEPLYILWADDNGPGSPGGAQPEGAYTINNFGVSVRLPIWTTVDSGVLNMSNPSDTNHVVNFANWIVGTDENSTERITLAGGHTFDAGSLTLVSRTFSGGNHEPHLVSSAGQNIWTGPIAIGGTGSTLGIIESADGSHLTLTGDVYSSDHQNNKALWLGGAGDGLLSGDIAANIRDLQKYGAGTWVVTGDLGHPGETSVTAGTLQIHRSDDLSLGGPFNGSGTVVQTGEHVLQLANVSQTGFTGNWFVRDGSTLQATTQSRIPSNNLILDDGTLAMSSSGSTTLRSGTRIIAGAGGGSIDIMNAGGTFVSDSSNQIIGSGALTKTGPGTLHVNQQIDFTGDWHLLEGVLRAESNRRLGADGISGGQRIYFDGGTLQMNSNTTINASRTFVVQDGGGTIDTLGSSNTVTLGTTNQLTGSGELIKTGAGTLTVNNAQPNFTGSWDVQQGTLLLNGAIPSSVAVSGGRLSGGGTITGSVTSSGAGVVNPGTAVGILTVNGDYSASTLFEINAPYTTAGTHYDQLIVSGAENTIDLSLATVTFVSAGGGSPALPNLITLIRNNTDQPIVPFANLAPGDAVTLGTDGNERTFIASYTGGSGKDLVLYEASQPDVVYVNDIFAGGHGQFISDADLGTSGNQPALFGVNAFSTISDAVSAVTDDGTIIVNGGTYGDAVVLAGSQTLRITGPNAAQAVVIHSLTTADPQSVIIQGSSTLTVGDDTDTTIASEISGSGSLAKAGNGTVTLTQTNSYTGSTVIHGGTLRIGDGGATGTLGGGGVTINANGMLHFDRSGALTLGGATSGAGTVVQTGGHVLELADATNPFTGNWYVRDASTVRITTQSRLPRLLTLDGGTLVMTTTGETRLDTARRIIVADGGGAIDIVNAGGTVRVDNATNQISGTGEVRKLGPGTLQVGDSNGFAGTWVLEEGTVSSSRPESMGNTATVVFNGGLLEYTSGSDRDVPSGHRVVVHAGGGQMSMANQIRFNTADRLSGTGALSLTGPGTLRVEQPQPSFTGTWELLSGGTLQVLFASNRIGGDGAAVVFDGGTLRLSNDSMALDPTHSFTVAAGGGTFHTTTHTLTLGTADQLRGDGMLRLTGSTGTGTLRIEKPQSFSGELFLHEMTLVFAGNDDIELAGLLRTAGSRTINNVMGSGATLTLADVEIRTTSNQTLAIDGSGNTIIAGSVFNSQAGTSSLTKTGTGTLTLAGVCTYTGATTVEAGTLRVNGSIANSATTVRTGATLGGTGTTGPLTIQAGGFHKPGSSIGITTVAGNYIENGTLEIEIATPSGSVAGTDYDQVNVTGGGTVTLGAAATLSVPYLGTAGTFNPAPGQVYVIINNDLADAVSGTFSGLPAGTTINVDTPAKPLKIFYNGGDGNDVVLVSAHGTPSTLYVNNTFTTANVMVDGNAEQAGLQPAYVGIDAFASVEAALAAYPSFSGTLVLNGGTYSVVDLSSGSVGNVTLHLAKDAGQDVTIQNLIGGVGDSIVTRAFGTADLIAQSGTFGGTIGGSGRLTKTGSGTLTLTGGNTYSNGTTISAGVVQVTNTSGSALGSGQVIIGNSGTESGQLTVDGGAISVSSIQMGRQNTASGTIVQNSGTVNVTNEIQMAGLVAGATGTTGRYEIYGGTLTVGTFLQVGRLGTGVFAQDGETSVVNVNRTGSEPALILGGAGTASGTYTLNAGTLNVPNSSARVGTSGSGVGQINVNGGTANLHSLHLGYQDTTSGTVVQNGGTVTVANEVQMAGMAAGATTARYELYGGTLTIGSFLQVGRLGTGVFIQDGADTVVNINRNDDALTIGGTGTGTYTLSNGTLNVNNHLAQIAVNGTATGTLNVSGGVANFKRGLVLARRDNSVGTLVQDGGVVNVGTLTGHSTYGTFGLLVSANEGTGTTNGTYDLNGGELRTNLITTRGDLAAIHWSGGTLRPYDADLAVSVPLTLDGGGATFNSTQADGTVRTITVGAAIGQSGGVFGPTKAGAGVLRYNTANTYTGPTEIQAGTLRLGAAGTLSDVARTSIVADALLDLNNISEEVGSVAGGGNVTLGSGTLTTGGDGTSSEFSGNMTGTGRLLKKGVGTMTLSGAGSNMGHLVVDGGTLALVGSAGVIANNSLYVGDAAGSDGTVTVADSATLHFNSTGTEFKVGNSGTGRIVQSGGVVSQSAAGAMYLGFTATGNGTYEISGGTLDQGSLSIGQSGGIGTFTQTGGDVIAHRDVRIGRSSAGVGSYTLSAGNLSVRNDAPGSPSGRLNVGFDGTGQGTFTQFGGIVEAVGGVYVSAASGTTGIYQFSGGQLRANTLGSSGGTRSFQWSGGILRPLSANLAVANALPLTLTGTDAVLNSEQADGTARTITIGAAIGQSGGAFGPTKLGTGTAVFNTANTYTGPTEIQAGTLRLGAAGTLSDVARTSIATGAVLDLNNINEEIGSLAGAGNVTLGSGTLTTGGDGTSTEFSGVVSGTGGLVKTGAGVFTLSGTNIFTGPTTVTAGTLVIDGSVTSNVTVNVNGTLNGSGTITGNVSGSGTFSPGNSPGVMTIDGDFTPTGTVDFEVNDAWTDAGDDFDQYRVSGAVDLSGATITFTNNVDSAAPTVHSLIKLIDKTSTGATTIDGNTAPVDGATVTIGSRSFRLFYNGGDGNDVVLVENTTPTTVYVSSGFTQNPGQVIADADAGRTGNQPAIFGVSAFTTIAAAQAAIGSSGTIVVNGGRYAAATLEGTQHLVVTGLNEAQAVTIAALNTADGQPVIIEGASVLTIGDSTNQDSTISGSVGGTGGLAKAGGGVLTLDAANDYEGTTWIQEGVLRILHDQALGTTDGGTVVTDRGTLLLSGAVHVGAEPLVLAGLAVGGEGALRSENGDNSFAGHITLPPGSFGGTISSAIARNSTTTTPPLIVSGPSPGGLQEDVLAFLDRTHQWNGATTAGIPAALLGADYVLLANNDRSAANFELDLSFATESDLYLFIDNRVNVATSMPWVAALGFTHTGWNIGVDEGGTGVGPGVGINNTSSIYVKTDVSGTITLQRQNAGNLNMYGVAAVGKAPFAVAAADGHLHLTGDITMAPATSQLILTGDGDTTISGSIEGGERNSLLKSGNGTLVLSGMNSYAGTTHVDAGTLLVDGVNSGDGSVHVNHLAVLGGTGSIAGPVNVNHSARLAPGPSVGSLDTGSVTWTSGAFFDVQIDGTSGAGVIGGHDILNVTGSVSLGDATLNLFGDFAPDPSVLQEFTIIQNDGADPVSGAFFGLPEGAAVDFNGQYLFISYVGGDGNDVVLSSQLQGSDMADTIIVTPVSESSLTYELNGGLPVTLTDISRFTFHGRGGDDYMRVDVNGNSLPTDGVFYHGGPQDFVSRPPHSLGDTLRVSGTTAGQTAIYTPSSTTPGDGVVAVSGGGTITFTGLEPVDVTGMALATLRLPGADDVITLSDGFDAAFGASPALIASGASAGVAIESAHFFGNTTVVIDTTTVDGNDVITIQSGTGAHDNMNVVITTGGGADTVNVSGSLTVAGDLTILSQSIAFTGGTLTAGAAGAITLNAGQGGISNSDAAVDAVAGSLIATATTRIDLDTSVGLAALSNTGNGSIQVNNIGSLTISQISTISGATTNGPIAISTTGNLTVDRAVVAGNGAATLTGGTAGTGASITINASVTASGAVTVLGGAGPDTITVNVTGASDLTLDGRGGNDQYVVQLGGMGVGNVRIADSGTTDGDRATVYGTNEDDTLTVYNNPPNGEEQTGGFVRLDAGNRTVDYTGTLEFLTVMGRRRRYVPCPAVADHGDHGQRRQPAFRRDRSAGRRYIGFRLVRQHLYADLRDDPDGSRRRYGCPKDLPPGALPQHREHAAGPAGAFGAAAVRHELDGCRDSGGLHQRLADDGVQRQRSAVEVRLGRAAVRLRPRDDLVHFGLCQPAARRALAQRDADVFAEVESGWYLVSVKTGDKSFARDRLRVTDANTVSEADPAGRVLLDNVSSPAGQIVERTFMVFVPEGQNLALTFANLGGDPYWVVNGIEIRPGRILTFGSPETDAKLTADGVTQTTFTGYLATPGALVTVDPQLDTQGDYRPEGTVTIVSPPDADPDVAGHQVRANAVGEFTYTIVHPSVAGTMRVMYAEVTGAQASCFSVDFVAPSVRRFDFNSGASPTQAPAAQDGTPNGYVGVLPTQLTSPAVGYGWVTAAQGFDRGALSVRPTRTCCATGRGVRRRGISACSCRRAPTM